MNVEGIVSPRDLAELVELHPSGAMTWRTRGKKWFAHLGADADRAMASWNTKHAGRPAFAHTTGAGYFHGGLLNGKVLAHRAVWALSTGRWPAATIDHINGNKKDNRPCNLRDVPHVSNCRNQPLSKGNTSGVTGVSIDRRSGKYAAHISVNGKTVHLGKFETLEEARLVRAAANAHHNFHPNHGRTQA